MTTLTLNESRTAQTHHDVAAQAVASNIAPERGAVAIPLVIPRDELYYWTATWQDGEQESRAALARGEGRSFPSAAAAIRALLDPNDA